MKISWAALALFASSAWADGAVERIPAELRSCLGIERNTERLACFDRGVAVILGDGAAAPSVESSFGMVASAPRADAVRAASAEDLKSVRGKVVDIKVGNDGSAVVTLDNGQVWRQISGGLLLLKAGDDVTINRAAMGSFQMVVPSGRTGKFKRVR
jgi:hypothetical protein